MAPPRTPLVYLVWHLYLEPVFALGGAYKLHFAPDDYFSYMPSTAAYSASSQIVCDVGHCYAAWCEMGDGVFGAAGWSGKDGVTNALNVLPVLIRTAYLLGIGMPREGVKRD